MNAIPKLRLVDSRPVDRPVYLSTLNYTRPQWITFNKREIHDWFYVLGGRPPTDEEFTDFALVQFDMQEARDKARKKLMDRIRSENWDEAIAEQMKVIKAARGEI